MFADLLEQVQQLLSRQPRVADLLSHLPPWFRKLQTSEGVREWEERHGVILPQPLLLYFAYPAAACWLQLEADTNTFMDDPKWFPDPPPLVHWPGRPCLVIGHFDHSATEIAVELNVVEPQVFWGCDPHGKAFDLPPERFTSWLGRIAREIVDGQARIPARGAQSQVK